VEEELLWTLMAYVEEFKPEETEGKELVQQRVEGMLASLPAVQTNKVFFRFLQIQPLAFNLSFQAPALPR